MFEKLYVWLLRFYPSHFRETYSDDALQLFRDRARDERGLFPRLRLGFDLLADWALSVSRADRNYPPALTASAHRPLDGAPSFHILEGEQPRPGALLSGCAISLLAVIALSLFVNHASSDRSLNILTFMNSSRAMSQQPSAPDATSAAMRPIGGKSEFDAAERQRVATAAAEDLKRYYMDPDGARKIADALIARAKRGDYNDVIDAATFAEMVTRQMQDLSGDRHLTLEYSQSPLPNHPAGPSPEGLASYRKAMLRSHCTFQTVETLPQKIGYIKLNSFPDPSICQATALAAMASVNDSQAIIFDLRENMGGFPEMVSMIAAYLFDHPEYLYNPRESPSRSSWTRSPVPGNKLADKPVYLLTSAATFSGAEQFSYDLKMLKRATLVGETTRGGAHAGVWRRIDDHFGMGIPEAKSVNPFSSSDWEGVGVAPDIRVAAADALSTAERLANAKRRE